LAIRRPRIQSAKQWGASSTLHRARRVDRLRFSSFATNRNASPTGVTRPRRLATPRATAPVSADFGYDRGTPIDRYYIERFLNDERDSIRGQVLEVKDST
jgi:hypothetical protein